ncbi:MAG: hypothetical protein AAF514_23270 [Verrucomicrobiota bacterium]
MEFYLASDARETVGEVSNHTVDYPTHQRLFEKTDFTDLNIFYRLSDYYQDTCFLEQDLGLLKVEIETALERVDQPLQIEGLARLLTLCEQGIRQEMNLYVTAD